MKTERFSVAIHALVWVLLLVIPYVSTDQVFDSLAPESGVKYSMLSIILSSVLIIIFYLNYFFLIPWYLLTKRHWLYSLFLFLSMTAVFFFSGYIFFYFGFLSDNSVDANPVVEKIIPLIIINTLLLWLLSIITSILWTIYNRLKQTETEKLNAQIAMLKSQINPHFLFNTLNNIYGTAINTSPKAADMVDKLSEMMRYTMKDTQQELSVLETRKSEGIV